MNCIYAKAELNNSAFQSLQKSNMVLRVVIKEIIDNALGAAIFGCKCIICIIVWTDTCGINLSIADWGKGLAPENFSRLISLGHKDNAEGNDFCQYGIGGTLAVLKALEKCSEYQFASHVDDKPWYALCATETFTKTMPVEELAGMPNIDSKAWQEVIATRGEPSTIVTLKGIDKKYAAAMFGRRKRTVTAEQLREAVIELISFDYRGLLKNDPMTNQPKLEAIVAGVARRGFAGNVFVQPATLPFSDAKQEHISISTGKENNYEIRVDFGRINETARETAIFGMPMSYNFEVSEAGQGCHLFVGGKKICTVPFGSIFSDAKNPAPTHPRYNQVGLVVDIPQPLRDELSLKFDKSAIDENCTFVQNLYKELRRKVNIKPLINDAVSTTKDMRDKYMAFLSMQPGREWECQPCMAILGGREFTDLYCRDKKSGFALLVKFVATSTNNPSIKDARELRYAQAYLMDKGYAVDELVLISKRDNSCLRKALEADKFRLVNKETGVIYDADITFKTAADFGWSV